MKKLLVLSAALFISTAAVAGLTDVYNAVNSNPDASATKVDQKAAEIKNKLDAKLGGIQDKVAAQKDEGNAKQETLKAQLEAKLSELKNSGEGNSSQAADIKAEIESVQKLIDAAKK